MSILLEPNFVLGCSAGVLLSAFILTVTLAIMSRSYKKESRKLDQNINDIIRESKKHKGKV